MAINTIFASGINGRIWNAIVRPAVMKRDNFECVYCSSTRFLDVHHIEPGNHIFNKLITLCKRCHKGEHKNG